MYNKEYHSVLEADFKFRFCAKRKRAERGFDYSLLENKEVNKAVRESLLYNLRTNKRAEETLNDTAGRWVEAATLAQQQHLSKPSRDPDPGFSDLDYFSAATRNAIKTRNEAYQNLDEQALREAEKAVKKGRRQDKRAKLDQKIGDGSWESTRFLRKMKGANPACLIDLEGNLRGARDKAGVISEYLHKVQFAKGDGPDYITPPELNNIVFKEHLGLDHNFHDCDLTSALKQLKKGKSAKPSGIPNEIWKLLLKDKELREELLIFFNKCLETGQVPESWELGEIVTIFKKKDPRKPENYRPITLLDTMYKIYTRLIANRLSKAVEPYLRRSQYGFRKHRSTAHAIHVLRRIVEGLFYKTDYDLNLVFLDWSKAFDRVIPGALTDALLAFGVGGNFLNAIQSTFNSKFAVLGQGEFPSSELKDQEVGIRQGCPLSPLLFIIMLTWLMEGVDRQYRADSTHSIPSFLPIADIFYADDTIFISTCPKDLQARFSLLEALAIKVGLTMNRDKTVVMLAKVKSKQTLGTSVRTTNRKIEPCSIYYSDGSKVKIVEGEEYLGSRISRTSSAMPEINRRVGLGLFRVKALKSLWQGTGISRKRKIALCDSLIGTKILYALETINMMPREERKLDIVQLRIYRRALGVAPPYVAMQKGIEYIKNDDILKIANHGSVLWSERVKAARVRLLRECRSAAAEEPIRSVIYQQGLRPRKWPGRKLPGASDKRGTWLQTAMANEAAQ